jgi:hypothetical protein
MKTEHVDKVVLKEFKTGDELAKAYYLLYDKLGLNVFQFSTQRQDASIVAGDKYTITYVTDFTLLCYKNDYDRYKQISDKCLNTTYKLSFVVGFGDDGLPPLHELLFTDD